jgi:hypothetical protein
MGAHLGVWVVGIGAVAVFVAWLCLVAGAEGEQLGFDLESQVLDRPAAHDSAPAPTPVRTPTLRAVADPEYGLMIVAEDEEADGADERWLPTRATA